MLKQGHILSDWLSLQLTKIDGQFFLEMLSNSVIFVNDVRVEFKLLNNGARITLGGVQRSHQQGSKFPPASMAGPHLIYEYQAVKDYLLTGIYQDPVFRLDELIEFDEIVGGRYVKEVYHAEDFNMTLVPQACCII